MQNHLRASKSDGSGRPGRPGSPDGPAYDALNEVYFDTVDDLLVPVRVVRHPPSRPGESDLVGESSFIACREEVV